MRQPVVHVMASRTGDASTPVALRVLVVISVLSGSCLDENVGVILMHDYQPPSKGGL